MATVSSVEQALQLSPAAVGEALAASAEDQWLERKSAGVSGQTIANLLVGFANAEGGVIIIGLSDDGVEGIGSAGAKRLTDWQRAHIDFTTPPVRCQFRLIDCITSKGRPDRLIVIEVESAHGKVHATNRDETYLRVGNRNLKLNFEQRRELLYDKEQASFECTPAEGATLDDLEVSRINPYAVRPRHSDPERMLKARGLIDREGRVTIAGQCPFKWWGFGLVLGVGCRL